MSYEHNVDSDLKNAVEYNGGLDLHTVDSVVAALYGENDGADYYWLLRMNDGTYGVGRGGCDYTGWDCQSDFNFKPAKTIKQAIKLIPEKENYYNRKPRQIIQDQVDGKLPFGTYDA